MQDIERRPPLPAIGEIVPVRNDVVDRAPGLTKRNAAVHAAGALPRGFVIGEGQDEFAIVRDAPRYRFRCLFDPLQFDEACYFPHQATSRAFAASSVLAAARFANISESARLYSFGNTLTNFARSFSQLSSSVRA